MENASQALIIAFSIIIFVIALTISISMFSMARATSDFVIFKSDKTNYYEYNRVDETSKRNARVVSMEAIVPTLYRYYKENYRVEFYDNAGKQLEIYESAGNPIYYFDVDDEIERGEPWIGSQESFKNNVDKIVKEKLIPSYGNDRFEEKYSTEIFTKNDDTGKVTEEDKKEKLIPNYGNDRFEEKYSTEIITKNDDTGKVTEEDKKEKIVIKYIKLK